MMQYIVDKTAVYLNLSKTKHWDTHLFEPFFDNTAIQMPLACIGNMLVP